MKIFRKWTRPISYLNQRFMLVSLKSVSYFCGNSMFLPKDCIITFVITSSLMSYIILSLHGKHHFWLLSRYTIVYCATYNTPSILGKVINILVRISEEFRIWISNSSFYICAKICMFVSWISFIKFKWIPKKKNKTYIFGILQNISTTLYMTLTMVW